jgi:hypothetical protein
LAAGNQPHTIDHAGTFQEKSVPSDTRLAGWAALIQTFGVQAPIRRPSAVSRQHVKASRREEKGWRYWPGESFGDQLGFALRHEDLDLLVLKRLFETVLQDIVTTFVSSTPTGASNRRAWFLYEFLTGHMLDIPDAAEAAEFLYTCVARAIDKDLPEEIDFLRRNDEAMRRKNELSL